MARRAGTVAVFTLGSRVLGFARDAVLGHVFGAGPALDAFVAAQTIPNVLRRLVGEGSLMIAFVPILADEKAKGGKDAMRRFTGAVLGLVIPLLVVLCALGVAFPEALVEAFAAGFSGERRALAVDLTRVMMPYLFFISLTALASGALNVQGRFAAPAAAPILLNVAIIAGAVVARGAFDVPIDAVAWGLVVGGVLQLALQLPFLLKERLLVAPRWAPGDPSVRLLARRMLPAVFGIAVYQLNMIVIRQIASFLPEGQLSCYFWATRLQEFALGVFAVSISIAALPTMSEHAARGDRAAVLATVRRARRATNFITVPAMVALIVLAEPIVGVLFRHGRFTPADGALTAALVQILGASLVPIGAVRVLVPTYYAVGDTRTPVWAAAGSLVTTAVAGGLLGSWLEIHGLTLATMLAAAVQGAVLAVLLRGRLRAALARPAGTPPAIPAAPPATPAGHSVLQHGLRCALAVAPGGVLVWLLARQWAWFEGRNLLGAALLAALLALLGGSYVALCRRLRVGEVDLLVGLVRRRLGRAR